MGKEVNTTVLLCENKLRIEVKAENRAKRRMRIELRIELKVFVFHRSKCHFSRVHSKYISLLTDRLTFV